MKMDPIKHLEDSRAARGAGRRRGALRKQHEGGKLTARGSGSSCSSIRDVRRDRQARHAPLPRLRDGPAGSGRSPETRRHRLGRVDGRLGLRLRAGLHVFGGSLSEDNAAKIVKIMDLAVKMGRPSSA
jgi:propionyl-CoA carboxylase beta chain